MLQCTIMRRANAQRYRSGHDPRRKKLQVGQPTGDVLPMKIKYLASAGRTLRHAGVVLLISTSGLLGSCATLPPGTQQNNKPLPVEFQHKRPSQRQTVKQQAIAKAPPSPIESTATAAIDPVEAIETPTHSEPEAPTPNLARAQEFGDLPSLQQLGQLRILINDSSSNDWQRDVAIEFAIELGLTPILLEMPDASAATDLLNEGLVDLIAANIAVNPGSKQQLRFSLPVGHTREQAIVSAKDTTLRTPADLAGRKVSAEPGSAFWATLKKLKRSWPTIQLEPEHADFDHQLLDRVASGEIDIAVNSSTRLKQMLKHRDDVRVAFNLARNKPQAWAMRQNGTELQAALNSYLINHQLIGEPSLRSDGDWEDIKQRGVLRVALRHDRNSYYLHNNNLKGFEYELLRTFAKAQKLRLEVVVPADNSTLLDELVAGRADVAAGFLAKGEQGDNNIVFSRSYHSAPQRIVSRNTDPINSIDDLAGHIITARQHSPSWRLLSRLEQQGLGFALDSAPDGVELDDLLAGIANGTFEATALGGPIAGLPASALPGLHIGPAIGPSQDNAWATRASNNELRQQLNTFLKKNKKGTLFYNVLWAKYFGHKGELARLAQANQRDETLTAHNDTGFDDMIRRHARKHGFDWRLITALVAQESGFNPKRRSKAGAIGLMQMMPAAAKQMKVDNVVDPDQGIEAGCRYLAWLWTQLDEDTPYNSRIWFTLAAYNAGLGHVRDARRLAKQKGWDSNRWFGNVENAMLLLAKPKYAKQARHGYVRGGEPVYYVRKIRRRYNAYRLHDQRILNRRQLLTASAD